MNLDDELDKIKKIIAKKGFFAEAEQKLNEIISNESIEEKHLI